MNQAKRMLNQAGGIEKVNAEAKTLFDKFGQGGTVFLGNEELPAFPAIRSLGNAFILIHEPGFPPLLQIRFGSHSDARFIVIHDPEKPTDPTQVNPFLALKTKAAARGEAYLQVASNIFFTR